MSFNTKTLELSQILETILRFAKSETAKNQIENIKIETKLSKINLMLDETLAYMRLVSRYQSAPFIEYFDIYGLLEALNKSQTLGIDGLLQFRLFLSMEKDVMSYFNEIKKSNYAFGILEHYIQSMSSHHHLYQTFMDTMDDQGFIYDYATDSLKHIRKELFRATKKLDDQMQRVLNHFQSYLSERMIVIRNERFCLPVQASFKNKVKGTIHDMSQSGQTVYIEPEVSIVIHQEIDALKVQEAHEIQKIISTLNVKLYEVYETLKRNIDLFVHFDFLQAKAIYAIQIDAIRPTVNKSGEVVLVKARHPLIDPKLVVPIHLTLNSTQTTILITGPNTGGKTVALKTLGLLTLMMQAGILIPADEQTKLAIFDQVFADIGDEQSIAQSLSTFSSHLTKIIHMIDTYRDNALILLDELGSGTDPSEGVALAIAILEKLSEKDVRVVVTTHYSELKNYAYEKDKMATASVKFDVKTLKPLYEIMMHTTGSSHALLIAKRLGLADDVINHAKLLYQDRQSDLAKVMEKLSLEREAIEQEKVNLAERLRALESEIKDYQAKSALLVASKDQVLEETQKKEKAKWDDLQKEALTLIETLKDSKNEHDLAKLKFVLNQKPNNEVENILETFAIGDEVYVKTYQQYGIITALKKEKYLVDLGHFKLSFLASELTKTKQQKEKKKVTTKARPYQGAAPKNDAKLEVDLRGFRYEDVAYELDKAIDQALLSNLQTLRIIHGFGTFAVKNAVYDYLKKSKYVKSMRYGGEGEGLNGVTIITLK